MSKINKNQVGIWLATMVITWGCMTFRYVGNGFSIALICFILFSGVCLFRGYRIPRIHLDIDLCRALCIFYGTLLIVGGLQCNTIMNTVGSSYSSVTLLMITLPLWMILFTGWQYDIRKPVWIMIYINMYAFAIYGIWRYFYMNEDRLSSFYGSPPEVGMLLDLLLPITVCLAIYYWKYTWNRILAVFLIMIEVVALCLTETRGSYLAFSVAGVSTLLVWMWKYREKISNIQKIVISLIMIFILSTFLIYIIDTGSESEKRMYGGERLLMWESSYQMWEDNKILGIGLSEWRTQYNDPNSPYHPLKAEETTNVMPHNIYLYFLSTGGFVSFVAFLVYIFFMIRYLLKNIWRYSSNPFTWGMLFIFIAFLAHGIVDGTIISKHIGRIFYLVLGISILYIERWKTTE